MNPEYLSKEAAADPALTDSRLRQFRIVGCEAQDIADAFGVPRREILDRYAQLNLWDGPMPEAAEAFREKHRSVTVVRDGNNLVLRPTRQPTDPAAEQDVVLRVPLSPDHI